MTKITNTQKTISASNASITGTSSGYEVAKIAKSAYSLSVDSNVEKLIFAKNLSAYSYKVSADKVSIYEKATQKLIADVSVDDTLSVQFNNKIVKFDNTNHKISASKSDNQHITFNIDSSLNAYKAQLMPALDQAVADISKHIPKFKDLTVKIGSDSTGSGHIAQAVCDSITYINNGADHAPSSIYYSVVTGQESYKAAKNGYDGLIDINIDNINDFTYMTAEHEFLHTLNVGGFSGTEYESKYKTAFDVNVKKIGSDYFFTGETAKLVYGGNVPLTSDLWHVDVNDDLMYPVKNDTDHISQLDWAILKDCGVPLVGINFVAGEYA